MPKSHSTDADSIDLKESSTEEERAFLSQYEITPHHLRYRNNKLIRYVKTGNRGPGISVRRRIEILQQAQVLWIGKRVTYFGRVGCVEFLMPYKWALSQRTTANPAARSFEAWLRWEDTGHRNITGVRLDRLQLAPSS